MLKLLLVVLLNHFFVSDAMIKKEDERSKVNKPAEKKKRKREKGNNFDGGDAIQTSRGLEVLDIENCLPIQISKNLVSIIRFSCFRR